VEVTRAVKQVALKAAKVLGCRDLARVDIRLSSEGIPYVLEVNPLPGLDPEESNLPLMAQAAGISYEALIHRILGFAIQRSLEAHSSIPLLKNEDSSPALTPPQSRALPDSRQKVSGSPEEPAVALARRPTRKRT
jgi:hypothetical protein